jgi:hypothetical protein
MAVISPLSTTRLECLAMSKQPSLLDWIMKEGDKGFETLTPGPNVIKLFFSVIYEFS